MLRLRLQVFNANLLDIVIQTYVDEVDRAVLELTTPVIISYPPVMHQPLNSYLGGRNMTFYDEQSSSETFNCSTTKKLATTGKTGG
jgi:hypothetical protein